MNYEEVLGPHFAHLLYNPGVQKLIHAFEAQVKPVPKADKFIFEHHWIDGLVYIRANGRNVAFMEREHFIEAIKACPWEKLYETRTEVKYERSPQDAEAMARLEAEVRQLREQEGKTVNDAVKPVVEKLKDTEKALELARRMMFKWRTEAKKYHRQIRLIRDSGGFNDIEIVAQNKRLREEKNNLLAQVNRLRDELQQIRVAPGIPVADSFSVIGGNKPVANNYWEIKAGKQVLCHIPVGLFHTTFVERAKSLEATNHTLEERRQRYIKQIQELSKRIGELESTQPTLVEQIEDFEIHEDEGNTVLLLSRDNKVLAKAEKRFLIGMVERWRRVGYEGIPATDQKIPDVKWCFSGFKATQFSLLHDTVQMQNHDKTCYCIVPNSLLSTMMQEVLKSRIK